MIGFLRKRLKAMFGAEVEFRAKLFNLMMLSGVAFNIFMITLKLLNDSIDPLMGVAPGVVSLSLFAGLLWYVTKTGRYMFGNIVTVVAIYLVIVPVTYFRTGGYVSGHSSSFLGFVVFTGFLLRGRLMVVFCVLEVILYISLVTAARKFPNMVTGLQSVDAVAFDIAISLAVFGGILIAMMALHFRLYDRDRAELIAARKKIDELSRLKQDIFTGMSHEIRTPLTVMSGYAQYAAKQLRSGRANDRTISDMELISKEAARLADLADSGLKALASSAPPEKMPPLNIAGVDLRAVLSGLLGLLSRLPPDRRPNITVDMEEGASVLRGDRNRLTQLLWNLLLNAAAHSGSRDITVRAVVAAASSRPIYAAGGDMVEITVVDGGSGIAPELMPRIFDRGVSGAGGSGIGLSICKEIAQIHGGDIAICSEAGEGTRVTVWLPKGDVDE